MRSEVKVQFEFNVEFEVEKLNSIAANPANPANPSNKTSRISRISRISNSKIKICELKIFLADDWELCQNNNEALLMV